MLEPISVSDIVNQVKSTLEGSFKNIYIQGEVSNLSRTIAGHYYFTLSDNDSSVSCALFKGDALRNTYIKSMKNGDEILVTGSIGVYAKRGTFQVIAKRVAAAGQGKLQFEFERLKAQLSGEGLFDLNVKKPIPDFPKRIAIITAPYGAALQDFLNIMQRRMLWSDIVIIPAIVQGQNSPKSLIEALHKAQEIEGIETIVLTRGGGSIEDLWSFNSEALIYEIAACEIPIISAVGHQIDFTLSDFVSDLRCETPSAAAQKLSQSHTQINLRLEKSVHNLTALGQKIELTVRKKIEKYNPQRLLSIIQTRYQQLRDRLTENRPDLLLLELKNKYNKQEYIDSIIKKAEQEIKAKCVNESLKLEGLKLQLNAVNPESVLNRGYAIIRNDQNIVVDLASKLKKEEVSIEFKDAKKKARII